MLLLCVVATNKQTTAKAEGEKKGVKTKEFLPENLCFLTICAEKKRWAERKQKKGFFSIQIGIPAKKIEF